MKKKMVHFITLILYFQNSRKENLRIKIVFSGHTYSVEFFMIVFDAGQHTTLHARKRKLANFVLRLQIILCYPTIRGVGYHNEREIKVEPPRRT